MWLSKELPKQDKYVEIWSPEHTDLQAHLMFIKFVPLP